MHHAGMDMDHGHMGHGGMDHGDMGGQCKMNVSSFSQALSSYHCKHSTSS